MRQRLSNLRAQLMGVSLVAMLPLVALGLYGGWQWQLEADQRAREEALRLARLIVAQEAGLVEGARQLLTALALLPQIRDGDPAACSALLADLLRQNPRYANLGVTTLQGDSRCSAVPPDGPLNLADRGWFQQALAQRAFVVGEYQISRVIGRAVVIFAAPILDEAGAAQGVISAALDLSWLNESVSGLDLPAGAVVTLADEQGVILARQPDPAGWVGQTLPEAPLLQALSNAAEAGHIRLTGLDGVERIYGFDHLAGGAGPHVAVGVPVAAIFARSQTVLGFGLASLVGAAGLALALAAVLAERSVLGPARVLVKQARRLAAGDLSARAEGRLPGELRVLASTFNQMAAGLETRERERQAALNALAASEARYRALFEGAGDGIFVADAQGRCLEANPAGCALLGYPREALATLTLADLLPAGEQMAEPAASAGLPVGQAQISERRLRRADGSTLEAEITSTALPDGRRLSLVRDHTTRRRLEATLRRTETFLSALLDQLPANVFVHDPEGRLRLVNRQWEESLRVRRADVLGRPIMDFLPPDQVDELMATSYQVAQTGTPLSLEEVIRHPGREVHLHVIKYPVFNAAGELEGVAGIALDITQRKQVEAALRQREEQFRLISELTSDYAFSFRVEPDGVLRREWGLGAFERISGYTYAEIDAAEDWLALVHPADQPGLQAFLSARLAEGTPGSCEFRLVTKAGANRQILGYFRPWRDESGQIVRLLGSGQDVTERRQAEQALRLAQFTMERAADGIFWIQPDGRLRAVNDSACRMLGYSHGELLSRSMLDTEAGLTAGAWSNYWEMLRQRRTLNSETWFTARDGRRIPVEVSTSYLEFADQTLACAFARDITERRRAAAEMERLNAELEQRVLERTARLEAANKELETFSYSVSHDLRAPLRAVNGFAAILAERHAANLDEEGRRFLGNIVVAGGRMSQLIDDLLAYARLGRRAVHLRPVPLGAVLQEVQQELSGRIAEAHAELTLPADLPVVLGDPGLLRQIFINLLENALLYHRPGVPPLVTLTARPSASPADARGQVVIAVADNGLGIRPEYHARIFDVFQRLHSDDQYPGTGLGLAMVRKAAGLLGGEVWLESAEGQGSTFFVRLTTEAP